MSRRTAVRLVCQDGVPVPDPVLTLSLEGLVQDGMAVLAPLALAVDISETVAVTGGSDCAQRALLRLAEGRERVTGCTVRGPQTIAAVYREPALMAWLSVAENLSVAAGLSGAEAEATLDDMGLGAVAGHWPGELPRETLHLVALARAFAVSPDLVLIDDPFRGDPSMAEGWIATLDRFRSLSAAAVLIVTPKPDLAERIAHRILVLDGYPAEIVADRRTIVAERPSPSPRSR
ncbi:MAG: hypothetical protein AAGA32_14765 [Pseudomonadota bacterium]